MPYPSQPAGQAQHYSLPGTSTGPFTQYQQRHHYACHTHRILQDRHSTTVFLALAQAHSLSTNRDIITHAIPIASCRTGTAYDGRGCRTQTSDRCQDQAPAPYKHNVCPARTPRERQGDVMHVCNNNINKLLFSQNSQNGFNAFCIKAVHILLKYYYLHFYYLVHDIFM